MTTMDSPRPLDSLYSNRQRILLTRDDRTPAELLLTQVTTTYLRRVFQVDPEAVWLRDEISNRAYFPTNEGNFVGLRSTQTLIVEGPPVPRSTPPADTNSSTNTLTSTPCTSGTAGGPHSASPAHPQFKSVVPGLGKRSSSSSMTCRVKIVKATVHWTTKTNKPSFNPSHQAYIEVQESTATVEYITEEIRKKWGESYTLVTNDGLELESSAATKGKAFANVMIFYNAMCFMIGLAFWKAPRRAIYAVNYSNSVRKRSKSRSKAVCSSDDDDDDFMSEPLPKKRKSPLEANMSKMMEEMQDLKKVVTDTVTLTKECKIPLPVLRMMRDSFKCKICHTIPCKPPLIISKCCKIIIGCEGCINSWYSGPDALTKSCPCCRHERGYNETMTLRGLDDFLVEIRQLISTREETSPLDDDVDEN